MANRSAFLLSTGMYKKQQCTVCTRWHLALTAAPPTAPCSLCSKALLALAPPPGTWSPAFVAHLAREQALEAKRLERGLVLSLNATQTHLRQTKRAA